MKPMLQRAFPSTHLNHHKGSSYSRRFFSTKLHSESKIKLLDGNFIPIIGLGTWKSKPNEVKEAVKFAIKLGYRHIDCAAVYKNEKEVGEGIRDSINAGLVKREDLFITSKLWNTYHHPDRVLTASKQTLGDLGLDYLDCYLIHWPVAFKMPADGSTYPKRPDGTADFEDVPLSATWKAMEELVKKGLVKTLGVSNFSKFQIEEIIDQCTTIPAINQIEMHPYLTQTSLINFCRKIGIAITAYSPLGTGADDKSKDAPVLLNDTIVNQLANQYNKTPAQVLLRWSIEKGFITIPKSINPNRITENYQLFDFELNNDDITKIDSLNKNQRYVAPVWSDFVLKNK